MKKIILASLVLSLAAAAVFAGKKINEYPESTVKNFMDSCMENSGGLEDYCKCTLQKIQEKYTHAEFAEIDRLAGKGETPQEFTDFMNVIAKECLKK